MKPRDLINRLKGLIKAYPLCDDLDIKVSVQKGARSHVKTEIGSIGVWMPDAEGEARIIFSVDITERQEVKD